MQPCAQEWHRLAKAWVNVLSATCTFYQDFITPFVNMVWSVVLPTQTVGNVERRRSYYLPLKIAKLLEKETNSDLVSFPFS